ncbi:MAG: DUF411 domain-containing protein [Pseudoxanthomonas suwonensis]|nr:DUF411 domain-containing protein [Pseudoxanthomonas suwonensis]
MPSTFPTVPALQSMAIAALLAACSDPGHAPVTEATSAAIRTDAPSAVQEDEPSTAVSTTQLAATTAPAHLPTMTVHKTPACGCCTLWVERMRAAGFSVEEVVEDDLGPIKQRLGVPYGKGSCHTAEVGGYLIEGHVPADDIKHLLAERPAARGLVLPGMPMGSPGMEHPDGVVQPYTVELVRHDGSIEAFSQHGQP